MKRSKNQKRPTQDQNFEKLGKRKMSDKRLSPFAEINFPKIKIRLTSAIYHNNDLLALSEGHIKTTCSLKYTFIHLKFKFWSKSESLPKAIRA